MQQKKGNKDSEYYGVQKNSATLPIKNNKLNILRLFFFVINALFDVIFLDIDAQNEINIQSKKDRKYKYKQRHKSVLNALFKALYIDVEYNIYV